MEFEKWTWQHWGDDAWVFGPMVRGIVRNQKAEVYYDENLDDTRGGWKWLILGGPRGLAVTLGCAVEACETALRNL